LDKINASGIGSLTPQERQFHSNFVPPDDRTPAEDAGLEFAGDPDLGLERVAQLLAYRGLRVPDQRDDVRGRRMTEVHHDVGVNVRDLGVADAIALEPALVDEPAGPDAFELLEDGTGARVPVEPGMPSTTPAEILLQDAMHDRRITTLELEGRRKHEVLPMMQDRVVVPEPRVGRVDRWALAPLGE